MATVSTALKTLIERRCISQAEIAKNSGVPQGAISNIVLHGREPKADTLTRLERAYPELVGLRLETGAVG